MNTGQATVTWWWEIAGWTTRETPRDDSGRTFTDSPAECQPSFHMLVKQDFENYIFIDHRLYFQGFRILIADVILLVFILENSF